MANPAPEPQTFDPRQPFSRADARTARIPLAELLGPRFRKLFYDRYVLADVPISTRLRAEAAVDLSTAGTYVSHHTAAELWGGVVPPGGDVHVTVPPDAPRSVRRGICAHRIGDAVPVNLHGLPISSPTQTFLDLATHLNLVDLIVLGDSLVRACRLGVDQLKAAAESWRGKGAKRARRAARLVRTGVDSPMESRLRMLIVLAGLPEPAVNVIIRADDGSWRLRFDLCYEPYRLIVEYDGRQHADDPRQWQRDIDRREELDAMGWRLIVVTSRDLFRFPGGTIERVTDALRERGARVPGQPRADWRAHFAAES